MKRGPRLRPPAEPVPPLPLGQLSDRVPGQSVMEELLVAHRLDKQRGRLGRIFGAPPLGPESAPWYRGALGEHAVGRALARLGPEWAVLHAVPVGRGSSDIDHVVIGPGWIFTLNTKNHTGQSVWTAKSTLLVAVRSKGTSTMPFSRQTVRASCYPPRLAGPSKSRTQWSLSVPRKWPSRRNIPRLPF